MSEKEKINKNKEVLDNLVTEIKSNPDAISQLLYKCRICLSETYEKQLDNILVLMDEGNKTSITIKDMLEISTGLKINPLDAEILPKCICFACLKLLRTSYWFNLKVHRTDELLQQILEDIKAVRKDVLPDPEITKVEGFKITIIAENPTPKPSAALSFKCNSCKLTFESPEQRDKHESRHKRKIFKCKQCSKTFNFRSGLHNHTPTCHPDNLNCKTCGKRFTRADILKHHNKTMCIPAKLLKNLEIVHTKDSVDEVLNASELAIVEDFNASCTFCEQNFTIETEFLNHMAEHADLKSRTCSICNMTFKRAYSLKKHMKNHLLGKRFNCPLCTRSFYEANELQDHMIDHISKKAYKCTKCSKEFITVKELVSHLEFHNKELELDREGVVLSGDCNAVCKIEMDIDVDLNTSQECLKTTELDTSKESKESLKPESPVMAPVKIEPIENTNNSDEDQTPDELAIKVQEKEEANEESNNVLPSLLVPVSEEVLKAKNSAYICKFPNCDKKYRFCTDMKDHYLTDHFASDEPLECPVCQERFLNKTRIFDHIKGHTEFICSICSKLHSNNSDLQNHIRSHNERQLVCPKCPRAFKTRNQLKRHMETHSDKKEFKCSICSKDFFSYNGMFLHMKGHSENKELQCPQCGKQFPGKWRLDRHIVNASCTRKRKKTTEKSKEEPSTSLSTN